MSLLAQWRQFAYGQEANTKKGQMFWATYFNIEKGIYEQQTLMKLLAEQFQN